MDTPADTARQIDRDIVNAHLNTARWLTSRLERKLNTSEVDIARYELGQLRAQLEATMGCLDPYFRPDSPSLLV